MRNLQLCESAIYENDLLSECDFIVYIKPNDYNLCNSPSPEAFILHKYVLNGVSFSANKLYKIYDFHDVFVDGTMPKPRAMWYRDLSQTLTVCFENGQTITLISPLNGDVQTENYLIEYHIDDIHWSPDEETALVVTDTKDLVLINSDLFTVAEIDLNDAGQGEMALVNVGWGKKETQFHGSAGKEAAREKPQTLDVPADQDLDSLQITWRDDSSLFAVSYCSPDTHKIKVKVFNSNGVLQCVSDEVLGIEGPISWKPQSSFVTFVQRLPNKQVIAFMEKNGLKHNDFTVPDYMKVSHLAWNDSASILCVVGVNKDTNEEEISLWTCGNYHWYLKQKISFQERSKRVWWDQERRNHLLILNGKELYDLEWVFAVNNSYQSCHENDSLVAVIDGEDVLLTSFKASIVPPPMCSYKLHCKKTVNQVLFAPPSCSAEEFLLATVHPDGSVSLFLNVNNDPITISPLEIFETILDTKKPIIGHWEWISADSILFFCSKVSTIVHLQLQGSNISLRNCAIIDSNVLSCTRSQGNMLLQKPDGKLLKYDHNKLLVDEEEFSFPERCFDVKYHKRGIFSLSQWGKLHINGSQISELSIPGDVISYVLMDCYAILTLSSHKLVVLHINDLKCVEISTRKIERGSRLITTAGNSVILQTPRGNLETIQPRALVIATISEMLDGKQYSKALSLMRKQRINLNLTVDHNQTRFLEDSKVLIEQSDPVMLTLLITELTDEDITKTSYKPFYQSKINVNTLNGTKVTSVCNNLLSAMSSFENSKEKYLFPMLSALVKVGDIEKAILFADTEDALQHLMFMVDFNKLYSAALGTFNLQAALKIAEKSQKDPKEYIPYLNSLREMEPNYMKLTICKGLSKLKSALKFLPVCINDHEVECMDFVKEHNLYSDALLLFKNDKKRYSTFADLYGEYLFKKRAYEESGMMFLRSKNSEKSLQSFIRSGNWRRCSLIAKEQNLSPEEVQKIVDHISVVLSSHQKYTEAALMYLEWLNQISKAVDYYIQGKCWEEAIHLAEKNDLPKLLDLIKSSLLENVNALLDSILANKAKMKGYVSRLKVVRIEKENRPTFAYDDISDSASDASSTSSVRTQSFQSKSSRNTKKMNKKMWSLKEGNPREEEALVATLSQMMESIEKLTSDVNLSLPALLYFEEDKASKNLAEEFSACLKFIDESKKVIWAKDPNEASALDDKYKHPPEANVRGRKEFEVLRDCLC